MGTIFKVFIEFLTILLLFNVLIFWPQCRWDFSSPTRDLIHSPCTGRRSLNRRTAQGVPRHLSYFVLQPVVLVSPPHSHGGSFLRRCHQGREPIDPLSGVQFCSAHSPVCVSVITVCFRYFFLIPNQDSVLMSHERPLPLPSPLAPAIPPPVSTDLTTPARCRWPQAGIVPLCPASFTEHHVLQVRPHHSPSQCPPSSRLSNNPPYSWAAFRLSIHPSKDTWAPSTL